MRKQLLDAVDRVRRNPREHIPEPGERLDRIAPAHRVKLSSTAAVLPPWSLPKKVQFPRPIAVSRLARSVAPLSISRSPSWRKRVSASH